MNKFTLQKELRQYKTIEGMVNYLKRHFDLNDSLNMITQNVLAGKLADSMIKFRVNLKTTEQIKDEAENLKADKEAIKEFAKLQPEYEKLLEKYANKSKDFEMLAGHDKKLIKDNEVLQTNNKKLSGQNKDFITVNKKLTEEIKKLKKK